MQENISHKQEEGQRFLEERRFTWRISVLHQTGRRHKKNDMQKGRRSNQNGI